MAATKPDISLSKKIFFYAFMLLFVFIILELSSYLLLKITRKNYSLSSLIETRNSIIGNKAENIVADPTLEVPHPYLGYVYDPTNKRGNLVSSHGGLSVSEYGFIDDHSPFYKKQEDTVVIGIFGGSVAAFFSAFGVDSLKRQLESLPLFKNKKFEFVHVALGGYKQPQQLLALTYLLSLGADFDVVINLDGFNEIVLPPVENIPHKVSPFFPRNWKWLSNTTMSNQTKSLVGKLTYLRKARVSYASMFNNSVLRFSNTMNLIWSLPDGFLDNKISEAQRELNVSTDEQPSTYQQTGPEYVYVDDPTMYRDLASHWFRSSQQMAKLSESNQILYWHFLQPNQYVKDSKKLSEEEAKIAISTESPYKTPAEQGYPAFIRAGKELADSNIQFHDLTMIFKDHLESVYADDCCHLNARGNKILGDTIGRLMVEDIEKRGVMRH